MGAAFVLSATLDQGPIFSVDSSAYDYFVLNPAGTEGKVPFRDAGPGWGPLFYLLTPPFL
jgi:hypothetical protein